MTALNSLAFSPDGRLLAGCDQAGTLYLWAVPGGDLLRVYHGAVRPVLKVLFTPGGESAGAGPAWGRRGDLVRV